VLLPFLVAAAFAALAHDAAAQVAASDDENFSSAPPSPPLLVTPPNGANPVPLAPTLTVSVSDPDADSLTVTFFGRDPSAISPDFTIIPIPDTQFYVSSLFGGTPAHFTAQTEWVVDHVDSLNIVYLCQLGDCVQNGDLFIGEWQNADDALSLIEDPQTTGLFEGVPYGVAVGNHDQSPWGSATGSTNYFNQFFGSSRFAGLTYYGGHYGTNNDNHYQLFDAGGLTFIAIAFEYDTAPDQPVLDWADSLLAAHRTRRGIVYSHYLIETGTQGSWGAQGEATYEALRDNPNLFLMLCGHISGEGRRVSVFGSDTVYTLLSDYQSRTNGGDGWMRIMRFSPAANQIQVTTYSPTLEDYETDGSSQFTLSYDMTGDDFLALGPPVKVDGGASAVASATASLVWSGRADFTEYEWFATVSDGANTVIGPTWKFTTGSAVTGVAGIESSPSGLVLAPIRPNPALGRAEMSYALDSPGRVDLSVFDVGGRLVRTLAGSVQSAGPHAIVWDGRTNDGSVAPAGVYFFRVATSDAGRSARLVLLR